MSSDGNVMCMSTNPIIVGRSESVVLNDSIDYELVEKRLKTELGFIDCNAHARQSVEIMRPFCTTFRQNHS